MRMIVFTSQHTVSVSVCVILHMSVITQDGNSALMEATKECNTEVVVELVKAGANIDMQNKVCKYKLRCVVGRQY